MRLTNHANDFVNASHAKEKPLLAEKIFPVSWEKGKWSNHVSVYKKLGYN